MNKTICECSNGTITEGIYRGPYPEDESGSLGTDGSDSLVVKSYTLINNNVEVVIITWGATIMSIRYPDKYGEVEDVVLGLDSLEDYMNPDLNLFIGCVLGRCADRIKNGSLRIKGREYQLSLNDGDDHLHGGVRKYST